MRRRRRAGAVRIAAAVVAALLGGCAGLGGRAPPRVDPATLAEQHSLAQVGQHLALLRDLVLASPADQGRIAGEARAAWERDRSAGSRLRHALVLGCPAYVERDPSAARDLLRDVLATPEALSAPERALAVVELQRLDGELRLGAEVQRLAAEADRERARARGAAAADVTQRRLAAEMEENAKLRRQLEEARAKLDAIANIERNSTDRKPPTEGRRP